MLISELSKYFNTVLKNTFDQADGQKTLNIFPAKKQAPAITGALS